MRWLKAILSVGVAFTVPVYATDYSTVTPHTISELDLNIRKVLAETNTPGAGIAIVMRDRVIWSTGIGKANVAADRDATEDTLFRIGSVSKSFVSLSVLKLQEEGKLSLDDAVRDRAPEIAFQNPWESTDPIRIVHLLEHTAGWDDLTLREFASNDPKPLTLKEGLDFDPRPRTSRWRPGTLFSYSNAGPPVAAYIVEKVTGMRFEDYVRENFFRPIHMDTTDYFFPAAHQDQMAQLYHDDGKSPYPYEHIVDRPSGSINASAREMGRYVQFFLNRGSVDGGMIVKSSSIDRMETPATFLGARNGLTAGYGLSNYTSVKNGFVFHGHDGAMEGGLANLAYLPEQGVGYALMTNSGSEPAIEDIRHLVVNFLTMDLPKPSPPPSIAVSSGDLKPFLGYAVHINPRVELLRPIERMLELSRVTFENDRLTISPLLGEQKRYVAVTSRLFREEADPIATLALIPADSGGPLLQRDPSTYQPVSTVSALVGVVTGLLAVLSMASSAFFALIWIPRKLLGKLKNDGHLSLRVLPLLAVLLFATWLIVIVLASDDIARLGRLTPWSAAIFGLGLSFASMALLALVQALRAVAWKVKRGVWLHSIAVAAASSWVAFWLTWWGLIGFRSWA